MSVPLRISNRDARRLWLWTTGLAKTPTGPFDVVSQIKRLGFLQIDTIRNVTRAHHHILWSRNQNYREKLLWRELGETRALFEHFTHDASLIPMVFYPMWQRQFARMGAQVKKSGWYKTELGQTQFEEIKQRINTEGCLSTHAFDTKIPGKREMWSRPPHKKALDQMWYAGELATSHRENFTKFYDLGERVFPAELRDVVHSDKAQIDWLCEEAMSRLSFASTGEIQRFWGATEAREVKEWIDRRDDLQLVEIEAADKTLFSTYAPADIEDRLATVPKPSSRLRILNPFDPAIRDRIRLNRLFGFAYRNEMFVPKTERHYGYYVYPLLEGTRFVGRIELKADRSKGWMRVEQFWKEPGVKWTSARENKLGAELSRLANFVDLGEIHDPENRIS